MNTRCFVTLTLILICLFNHSNVDATTYAEGTWDFTSLATDMTIGANHIIVGEVTAVSLVFHYLDFEPLSAVTVRVLWDAKEEIERVKNQVARPENNSDPRMVSFVQVGGPLPDGDTLQAVGVRVLKVGDRVFLRLRPTVEPIINNGQTYNSTTEDFGTVYSVESVGDKVAQNRIIRGWRKLDMTVLEMTRIVRATLTESEQMRTFERQMSEIRNMPKAARFKQLMDKVGSIETASNLASFE